MKNNGKNRPGAESYSVSEAAAMLGVSIPTLKHMAAERTIETFRTPGGHLRILAESIEAVREQRPIRSRPVREASPVLQNRRERLEELTIEAQEMRARREVERLRREEQEEAETREAEAEAREEEKAQRQAELELERERFAQEQERMEQEQDRDRQRCEAERKLAAFRSRCLEAVNEALSGRDYAWLSTSQRKEILDALEVEMERRQLADEPRTALILARSLEALLEPFRAKREAQKRRQSLTERVLWSLPCAATDAEKVQATTAIREALQPFEDSADEREMRVAAEEAVEPFKQAVKRRELDEKLIKWAIFELPWTRNDRDSARLRRECTEILAELPADVSEAEAKEALEPTVTEARREIESRQVQKEREARKAGLVKQGVREVQSYMLELEREGEITSAEYWDREFADQLRAAVRRGLEADLAGDETAKKVRELAREIVNGETE